MEWLKGLGLGLGCITSTVMLGIAIFLFYNGMILWGIGFLIANYWLSKAMEKLED